MKKIIDSNILICTYCNNNNLVCEKNILKCLSCERSYIFKDDKLFFIENKNDLVTDNLDKIKYYLKKYTRFYTFLIFLISPVFVDRGLKKFLKNYINNDNLISLNIGSGNSRISDNVINIDMFNYENVDIICNINKLPFKDNSVDIVLNIAVLEHVKDPDVVVAEIFRVLKPNGLVYSTIPFIQGFHASPFDFSRFTIEGISNLYKDFIPINVYCSGGPTSGFLWVFQEWLAMLLSLGFKPIYNFVFILLMITTFPLKFLDFFLINHPMAKNISSAFTYIGRKNIS